MLLLFVNNSITLMLLLIRSEIYHQLRAKRMQGHVITILYITNNKNYLSHHSQRFLATADSHFIT